MIAAFVNISQYKYKQSSQFVADVVELVDTLS